MDGFDGLLEKMRDPMVSYVLASAWDNIVVLCYDGHAYMIDAMQLICPFDIVFWTL